MSQGDIILAQASTTAPVTGAVTQAVSTPVPVVVGRNHLYVSIGTFLGLTLLVLIGLFFLERQLRRYTKDADSRRSLRRGRTLVGVALIALLAAYTFSADLTGLTISLGIAGAAVAFALQQVLSSAVAWLHISIGKVYRTGDRVKMGGVTGDVISINVFLTTLMEVGGGWVKGDQYSGRIVRVPNAAIYNQPVYNYSSEFEYLWDEMTVPVKYGSDRALVEKLMQQIVTEHTMDATTAMQEHWEVLRESSAVEDAILEPQIFLVATDNWLEYSLRYLVHYKRRRATKSGLFQAILTAIDANPEKVGIASGTYDIVGLPRLTIDIANLPKELRP